MTNEQLVIRIKAGVDVADNMLALWQQNRGFIYKIVNQYKAYADAEDLEQEGYLGLSDAVNHSSQMMTVSIPGHCKEMVLVDLTVPGQVQRRGWRLKNGAGTKMELIKYADSTERVKIQRKAHKIPLKT